MLSTLKAAVCSANKMLPKMGLVSFTWGNVSGIDRKRGLVVIKPSGVSYDDLMTENMVVLDLDGNIVEGSMRPSSDTPTHLELYKSFPEIGGIVHTHSLYATAFAQAKKPLRPLGTTHADYFFGEVPCTRELTANEVLNDYERNTGKVIAETYAGIDPEAVPAVLVANHGVFAWGKSPEAAVECAAVLEQIAKMNMMTEKICPDVSDIPDYISQKHYFRKHGADAYYGQK